MSLESVSKINLLNNKVLDVKSGLENAVTEIESLLADIQISSGNLSSSIDALMPSSDEAYTKPEYDARYASKKEVIEKIAMKNVKPENIYTKTEMDSVFPAPEAVSQSYYPGSEIYTRAVLLDSFTETGDMIEKSDIDTKIDVSSDTSSVIMLGDIVPITPGSSSLGTSTQNAFKNAHVSGKVRFPNGVTLSSSSDTAGSSVVLPSMSVGGGSGDETDPARFHLFVNESGDLCATTAADGGDSTAVTFNLHTMRDNSAQDASLISDLGTQLTAYIASLEPTGPSTILFKFTFDETLSDASTNQINGTPVSGTVSYVSESVSLVNEETRTIDSLVLDDSTGLVLDASNFDFSSVYQEGFTVAFWGKLEVSNLKKIVTIVSDTQQLEIRCMYGGVLQIVTTDGVALQSNVEYFIDNQWTHYAIRATPLESDPSKLKIDLFQNNIAKSVVKIENTPLGIIPNFLSVADVASVMTLFTSSEVRSDSIGELFMVKRSLTDDEITELYAVGYSSLRASGTVAITVGDDAVYDIEDTQQTETIGLNNVEADAVETLYVENADAINWAGSSTVVDSTISIESTCVSMSSDGSVYATSNTASNTCTVYMKDETLGTWSILGAVIPAPADAASSGFGLKCVINSSGNIVAVSRSSGTPNVNIFKYVNGSWVDNGRIACTSGGVFDAHSLTMNSTGNIVAIGNGAFGSNSGVVEVWQNTYANNFAWVQIGIFNGTANSLLGQNVSLDSRGHTLVFSRYGDSAGFGGVQVYTFNETAAQWSQVGALIKGSISGEKFGYSVSSNSDASILAIGTTTTNTYGKVYFYKKNSVTNSYSSFGNAVSGTVAGQNLGKTVALNSTGKICVITSATANVQIKYYSESFLSWYNITQYTNNTASSSDISSVGERVVVSYTNNSVQIYDTRVVDNIDTSAQVISNATTTDSGTSGVAPPPPFTVPSNVASMSATKTMVGQVLSDLNISMFGMNKLGTVIIGSLTNNTQIKAYKYNASNNLWEQYGNLIPYTMTVRDGDPGAPFYSLNLIGNIFIVGFNNENCAKVYKYNDITQSWNALGQTLSKPNLDTTRYGVRTNINNTGNIITISDWKNMGLLTVFRYKAETNLWEQVGSDFIGGTGSAFGYFSSLSEDALTISVTSNLGTVYLYRLENGGWTNISSIAPVAGANSTKDNLNRCNELNNSGNTILCVSVTNNNSTYKPTNALAWGGVSYVFRYNGSAWIKLGDKIHNNIDNDFQSNYSACINSEGNMICLFSSKAGTTGSTWRGGVNIYAYNSITSTWIKVQEILGLTLDTATNVNHCMRMNTYGNRIAVWFPKLSSVRVFDITF